MRRTCARWPRGEAGPILSSAMIFVRLLRPILPSLLLASLLAAPSMSAAVWRDGAWVLERHPLLGAHDCELRLAAPAAAAWVTLRPDRLDRGWEIAVRETRRDIPADAGDVLSWRRSDGPSGVGRLAVLGVGLAILRLPSEALRDLPAAGEIEVTGAGVPFVWRMPLAGLAEGLSRLERCASGE